MQDVRCSYKELKWSDAPLDPSNQLLPPAAANPSSLQRSLPLHSTALLVVDVQPEYWSQCPVVRADFPHFPAAVRATVAACRQRNLPIVWVRADYRRHHSPWLTHFERLRGSAPDFRVEVPLSKEWEDFATPVAGETIVPKSSWSSTSDTKLIEKLKEMQIDTVLVCGLLTSVCVQHSAFGVFEAGFRTLLVTDACGDRGRARHDAALALYGDYMYELVTSSELDNQLVDKPAETQLEQLSQSHHVIEHDESDQTSVSDQSECSQSVEDADSSKATQRRRSKRLRVM